MVRIVHYHHPLADNFSLVYSSDTPERLYERREGVDGATKIIGYPFDTPVYVLYERSREIESANEIDYDRKWLTERINELPRPGQVTAFRLVELLDAAVDARKEDEFRLYKEFEPRKIQQALTRVPWGGPLPPVAGALMSNLVLRHSLPNANHRTSIALLQFCIESVDSTFEMSITHVNDHTWQDWVDPYIVDSKQLIAVRRNNVRFKHLEELNVDLVERKDGIQIPLADFELDMHWREALEKYAVHHEKRCTDFVRATLERADREDLYDRDGPTESEFVEYLETGLVERDFRDMF